MISSADFNRSFFGSVGDFSTANRTRRGASNAGRVEADDVVSGRSHDRQWANLMSASGQLNGRLRAVSRGRRHTVAIAVTTFGAAAAAPAFAATGQPAATRPLPETSSGSAAHKSFRSQPTQRSKSRTVAPPKVKGAVPAASRIKPHALVLPKPATPKNKTKVLGQQKLTAAQRTNAATQASLRAAVSAAGLIPITERTPLAALRQARNSSIRTAPAPPSCTAGRCTAKT